MQTGGANGECSSGPPRRRGDIVLARANGPTTPTQSDLTVRGFAILWNFNGANKSTWNGAVAMFERALTLDPQNAPEMTGLCLRVHTEAGAETPQPTSRVPTRQPTPPADRSDSSNAKHCLLLHGHDD